MIQVIAKDGDTLSAPIAKVFWKRKLRRIFLDKHGWYDMKPMKIEKKLCKGGVYRQCPYSAAELGEYYTRHIAAMTEEGLHGKFEIALELAWRDKQIEDLKASRLLDTEW